MKCTSTFETLDKVLATVFSAWAPREVVSWPVLPTWGQFWAQGHVCETEGEFLHLCTGGAPAGGGNGPTHLGPSCEVQ